MTVTYTVKAERDSLRNLVIHMEGGRLYEYTDKGPVRHDVVLADEPQKQMRTDSLPELKKGEARTVTFRVSIPALDSKALKKAMPYPDNEPPLAAAWTSFQGPDGKPGYTCQWVGPIGRVQGGGVDLTRDNFMASWWLDTAERPNEKNQFLHYWGPTDRDRHELELYRNYERVRKALNLPDTLESRGMCYHLWGHVVACQYGEKTSQEAIIARMIRRVKRIAARERISRLEAAGKFLIQYPPPPPLPQPKALIMESVVKKVTHRFQLTVEDYKTRPGKEGIKPTRVGDLLGMLPKEVAGTMNPFIPQQSYSPTGGGLVDGYPEKPGQVGYVYKGQEQPYLIQALGDSGRVIISLGEPE